MHFKVINLKSLGIAAKILCFSNVIDQTQHSVILIINQLDTVFHIIINNMSLYENS